MSKKIFVGNLSFQTTERDLTDTFSQHGPVEAVAIITDRETGRSKGFGFVTMTEGADKAIAQLSEPLTHTTLERQSTLCNSAHLGV